MTTATQRDEGLVRVKRVTRWLAAGAVAAAAAFSITAAKVVPGRSHAPSNTVATPDPNAVNDPNSPYYQDPGLQSPDQPPMRAYNPPRVSSGGS